MEEEFEELEEELLPLLEIELLPLPVLSTITTDPPLEAVAVPALVSGLVPDVLVSRFTNAKNGNNIPFSYRYNRQSKGLKQSIILEFSS